MSDRDWVEVFTQEFDQPESAVAAGIWAEALGDEYPAELAPHSYTARSEAEEWIPCRFRGGSDSAHVGDDSLPRVLDRPR